MPALQWWKLRPLWKCVSSTAGAQEQCSEHGPACRLLAAYFEPQDTGKPQKIFLFLTLSCPFSLLLLPLLQGRHRILNPSLQAQLMKLRNCLLTTRVRAGWKGSLAYLDCLDQKTSAGGSVLHPVEGTPQRQAETVWAHTAEFPYPALLHQIISLAWSSDLNMNVTSFPRVLVSRSSS